MERNGSDFNARFAIATNLQYSEIGDGKVTSGIFDKVKHAANGQAVELLTSIGGIPPELLDGRGHPCPRCGGTDRFSLIDPDAGAVLCRHCFKKHNGDFIAAIAWSLDIPMVNAARKVANSLGILRKVDPYPDDPIRAVERVKFVPSGWLSRYGAIAEKGKYGKVARVPMFDAKGDQCSHFDLTTRSKGYSAKGKPTGLFLPVAKDGDPFPPKGEVLMVEGVKDAATLHSLGYYAIGLPSSAISEKHAAIVSGLDVIIVPDLDHAGIGGASKSAERIQGIAKSVRIARLPGDIKKSKGNDVRDIRSRVGGETAVINAIAEGKTWNPSIGGEAEDKNPSITNHTFEVGDDDKKIVIPKPMGPILKQIDQKTGNWPRRVDRMLFVHDEMGVSYLNQAASLFGYLSTATDQVVEWERAAGCVTKDETFQELRRTATRYDAIEMLPHEPKIPSHYYACDFPTPGNGEYLSQTLDCFRPATPTDRALIQSLFMTVFAGLPPGTRPAFVITGPAGRGIGKSKLVEMLGALTAPPIQFDAGDDIREIKQRLLTPESMQQRIAWLDNVKSHRFSWAELEGMITSPVISGKRMYYGDASRPNTLTWCITLNGASLSTDMAQRAVMIELDRPKRSAGWEEDTREFIREHRQQIIADIISELQREPFQLDKFSRWATWERAILQRLPDPTKAQSVIEERQVGADVEAEEAWIVEEHFSKQIHWAGILWQSKPVFIPGAIAWKWYMAATGDRISQSKSTRILGQLIEEGRFERITKYRDASRRGFMWNIDKPGEVENCLQEKLEQKNAEAERKKLESEPPSNF